MPDWLGILLIVGLLAKAATLFCIGFGVWIVLTHPREIGVIVRRFWWLLTGR